MHECFYATLNIMFNSPDDIVSACDSLFSPTLGSLRHSLYTAARRATWFTVGEALDTTTALGVSKIGGVPDVPADFSWPTHEGQHLAFLYQLRCDDHLLLVFIGHDDSGMAVAHHVEFIPLDAPLSPAIAPEIEAFPSFYKKEEPRCIFHQPHTLVAHSGYDLPRWFSSSYAEIVENAPDFSVAEEVLEQLSHLTEPDADVIVRYGGYHSGIGYDPADDIDDGSNAHDWTLLTCLESYTPQAGSTFDELCLWDAGYFQILTRVDPHGTRHTYGTLET